MLLGRRQFLCLGGGRGRRLGVCRAMRFAQAYPSRPVRWIVPFPAGGTTDLAARLMAQWLTTRLGQQVVVENKPGGGTNIGVQAAVTAPADGYTLLFTLATNAINPSLYKSLPFDFQRDIAPVAGLADLPLVMDVNPSLPRQNLCPTLSPTPKPTRARSISPRSARGPSAILPSELFETSAGIDVVRVPYPGDAPMLTD